ncbi:MAG: transcriptional regulator, partial [Thermococcus sp.]
REVLQKASELDRFVPLRIKDGVITIDDERLKTKLGGEDDAGED